MVALTGRLRPKGVPFSRFGCMKEKGFTCRMYGMVGKSVKRLTDAFYGCEKIEKTSWFCDLYYYMRNFCNLTGLEQWFFSLI